MAQHRVFEMSFASVYPHYVNKAERKDRTKEQIDEIIFWLTGYDNAGLQAAIDQKKTFREFFDEAPALNPNRLLIKGVVCGVRVEDVPDPLMREIRYLDKMIDELARGKIYENIFRKPK